MDNQAELTEQPLEAMVAVFSSSNHDAEMEVLTIKGILDRKGVPAQIVGPSVLPKLSVSGSGSGRNGGEGDRVLLKRLARPARTRLRRAKR